jgi:hypothetical protein
LSLELSFVTTKDISYDNSLSMTPGLIFAGIFG